MTTPSRWPTVPLGEVVAETQYGTALKANEAGSGVVVLRMNNITYSGAIDLTDLKHVELPPEDIEQFSVRRGDILFNRTNSQGLVGKTAVWNRDEMCAFAGYLVRIRLQTDRADPRFVAAWFNTPGMKTLLRTRAKPSINMANINATEVLTFPLVLPPLPDQRRIAGILDRAEALRAKRRAALAQLDTLTQAIFTDMFGDPMTNPKGWPETPLALVCSRVVDCPHTTPKWTQTGVTCLRTSNLTKGEWEWTDHRFVSEEDYTERSKRETIEAGDIILSREGTVGIAAIVPKGARLCMGQRLVQLRPKSTDVTSRVLLWLILYYLDPERIHSVMAGSTSKHLNVAELRKLQLTLPPLPLQREYDFQATAVEQLRSAHRASLVQLDALFASLQHRAFRGEL